MFFSSIGTIDIAIKCQFNIAKDDDPIEFQFPQMTPNEIFFGLSWGICNDNIDHLMTMSWVLIVNTL